MAFKFTNYQFSYIVNKKREQKLHTTFEVLPKAGN